MTRRLPTSKIRIVDREPADYARELQEKLENIDGVLQGILATLDELATATASLSSIQDTLADFEARITALEAVVFP